MGYPQEVTFGVDFRVDRVQSLKLVMIVLFHSLVGKKMIF